MPSKLLSRMMRLATELSAVIRTPSPWKGLPLPVRPLLLAVTRSNSPTMLELVSRATSMPLLALSLASTLRMITL